MIIEGRVYDITRYIRIHPGGNVIMQAAGKDGTNLIRQNHPWINCHALLQKCFLGVLKHK